MGSLWLLKSLSARIRILNSCIPVSVVAVAGELLRFRIDPVPLDSSR
jgi:hypothetical protein